MYCPSNFHNFSTFHWEIPEITVKMKWLYFTFFETTQINTEFHYNIFQLFFPSKTRIERHTSVYTSLYR